MSTLPQRDSEVPDHFSELRVSYIQSDLGHTWAGGPQKKGVEEKSSVSQVLLQWALFGWAVVELEFAHFFFSWLCHTSGVAYHSFAFYHIIIGWLVSESGPNYYGKHLNFQSVISSTTSASSGAASGAIYNDRALINVIHTVFSDWLAPAFFRIWKMMENDGKSNK